MTKKVGKGGADYRTPVSVSVEISLEGILCESGENESYEDVYEYGKDLDNKGWY